MANVDYRSFFGTYDNEWFTDGHPMGSFKDKLDNLVSKYLDYGDWLNELETDPIEIKKEIPEFKFV